MTVDEETVFDRRNDVPSKDYIYFRIPLYLKLSRYLNLTILNGSTDVLENFSYILKDVSLVNLL
jgi:hypothetical protein